MILGLWRAGAGAQPVTAGFRIPDIERASRGAVRQVVIVDPGDPATFQTTGRARLPVGSKLALDIELPYVVSVWGRWSDQGPGPLRVSGPAWYGDRLVYGLEAGLPLVPPRHRVSAWGSVARETAIVADALFFTEMAGGEALPWSLRLVVGVQAGAPFIERSDPVLVRFGPRRCRCS